ncbi:cysteine desulfurase family protein [Luteolibacter sp. AS25]|uniref:cysteine desulfurase family protein n=1 Tax=Luteolibacter sp. AS25 TaxID=3135776 RepID=UPI00398B3DD3
MIDLDANATTAILPEVLDAMLPWLSGNHSNPSGSYRTAKLARNAIAKAREQVAGLIGAEPEEIVFTGSGTESVNTALNSLNKLAGEGSALTSGIEHSAVLRFLESRGREVLMTGVNRSGVLDLEAFERSCATAGYVSVMAANNETGIIQPLGKVVKAAKKFGLPVHTDAIQAVGKVTMDVKELAVDMLSMSGHKFHGPKGIGALYIRSGLEFSPFLRGGGQESGRRSSTENTASIVAMGKAAEIAAEGVASGVYQTISKFRDEFENFLLNNVEGCTRNGDPTERLPNTSHLSFDGCDAAGLLILLDNAGIACSAGSACMTGKQKPSHVQIAMGIPEERAKTSLRFSFSRLNTREEGLVAAEAVKKAVEKLRNVQGSGIGPVAIYTG